MPAAKVFAQGLSEEQVLEIRAAIQAQQKMVNSPNHTEVYIPVGPMGVPVVGTMKLGQEGKQ